MPSAQQLDSALGCYRYLIHNADDYGSNSAGVEAKDLSGAVPLIDHQYRVTRASLDDIDSDIVVPRLFPF